ncbi:DUF397 domain-containing protein [Embleya sp. NPDC050493]|uniref:DUF397 domain-containing protein n=1 Tax=Embleya sp. NPDC050493 TaxID=3363989 RepID=UPI0037A03818
MSNTNPGAHFRFDSPRITADSQEDLKAAGHSAFAGHAWRRSTYSGATSNCVETAPVASAVLVRDSKVAAGPVLRMEAGAWQIFIGGIGA